MTNIGCLGLKRLHSLLTLHSYFYRMSFPKLDTVFQIAVKGLRKEYGYYLILNSLLLTNVTLAAMLHHQVIKHPCYNQQGLPHLKNLR